MMMENMRNNIERGSNEVNFEESRCELMPHSEMAMHARQHEDNKEDI